MQVETQIEDKILALLAEFIPQKKKLLKITEATDLQRELGVNSIALMSMVFRVEEEFKVDFSHIDFGAELAKLRTVGDVLEISKQLLATTMQRVS